MGKKGKEIFGSPIFSVDKLGPATMPAKGKVKFNRPVKKYPSKR